MTETKSATDWPAIQRAKFALVIYLPSRWAKDYVADVLQVDYIAPNGRSVIFLVPTVVTDRGGQKRLRWNRRKRLPVRQVLHAEPLTPDFDMFGTEAYIAEIERVRHMGHLLQKTDSKV